MFIWRIDENFFSKVNGENEINFAYDESAFHPLFYWVKLCFACNGRLYREKISVTTNQVVTIKCK